MLFRYLRTGICIVHSGHLPEAVQTTDNSAIYTVVESLRVEYDRFRQRANLPPSSLTWAGVQFQQRRCDNIQLPEISPVFAKQEMFFSGCQRSSTLSTTKKQRKTKTASHLTDGTESFSRSENAAVRSRYSLSVPTPYLANL